eukprot:165648-Pelagomonas_calceolata.AAC.6
MLPAPVFPNSGDARMSLAPAVQGGAGSCKYAHRQCSGCPLKVYSCASCPALVQAVVFSSAQPCVLLVPARLLHFALSAAGMDLGVKLGCGVWKIACALLVFRWAPPQPHGPRASLWAAWDPSAWT